MAMIEHILTANMRKRYQKEIKEPVPVLAESGLDSGEDADETTEGHPREKQQDDADRHFCATLSGPEPRPRGKAEDGEDDNGVHDRGVDPLRQNLEKSGGSLVYPDLEYGTSRSFSGIMKMARIIRRHELRAHLNLCFMKILRVGGEMVRKTAVRW